MKTDFLIIPECYTDTNLIETLVPPNGRGYNHQMGCNKVASKMQNDLKDSFALGIIDKDKKAIKYLDEFELITQNKSLYLYKHKTRPHFIIQIYPAIEKFILESASDSNVSVEDFALPSDLERLKGVTKKLTSKRDKNLSALFKELNKNNAPQLRILSSWVNHLKKNTYNSDINFLKNS